MVSKLLSSRNTLKKHKFVFQVERREDSFENNRIEISFNENLDKDFLTNIKERDIEEST